MGRQSCHPFLLFPRLCLVRFGGRFFLCFSLHNFPIFPNKEPSLGHRAKRAVCTSPGFIDFVIGPVNSALPFAGFKLQFRIVISTYQNFFGTSQSDF